MSFKIGPPGCLQYYQDTYGIIQRLRFNLLTILQHTAYNILTVKYIFFYSFNFPTGVTAVTAAATHLINQKYSICIRRGLNFCYICYSPQILPGSASASAQNSFGLS